VPRTVSRREALTNVGVAMGASVLAPKTRAYAEQRDTSQEESGTEVLFGLVSSIDPPSALYLTGPVDLETMTTVTFQENAVFFRDQDAVLTDFAEGDEVVAVGEWLEAGFLASSLSITYRMLSADVLQRTGDRLITPLGSVQLTDGTYCMEGDPSLQCVPSAQISAGDQIVAFGRYDPSSNATVALKIGVEPQPL
jgi:hypothetical protein